MAVWIWTAVVAVSLIIEFITMDLVTVWFAGAGIVGLILAACGAHYLWQIGVFIVLSAALLLGVRRFAVKFLFKNSEKTNTEALTGSVHTLLKDIANEKYGTIKINGVEWNCITEDGSTIAAGEKVVIEKIQGNKFIVSKKENK